MNEEDRMDEDVKKIMSVFPPSWSHPSYRSPHYLTKTELKVLNMIAFGKMNKEIADILFISPLTVRTHVKRIHAKCDIKGRSRLAIAAYKFYDGVEHVATRSVTDPR